MSACARCGYNPLAQVAASWTFTIAREIASLNAHRVNSGTRWQRVRYQRERDEWTMWCTAARVNSRIPNATAKRRVTITRVYSGRQREFDHSNLVGGCKPLWDAMVRAYLLVDDKPAFLEESYMQQRGARSVTIVTIEELAL